MTEDRFYQTGARRVKDVNSSTVNNLLMCQKSGVIFFFKKKPFFIYTASVLKSIIRLIVIPSFLYLFPFTVFSKYSTSSHLLLSLVLPCFHYCRFGCTTIHTVTVLVFQLRQIMVVSLHVHACTNLLHSALLPNVCRPSWDFPAAVLMILSLNCTLQVNIISANFVLMER